MNIEQAWRELFLIAVAKTQRTEDVRALLRALKAQSVVLGHDAAFGPACREAIHAVHSELGRRAAQAHPADPGEERAVGPEEWRRLLSLLTIAADGLTPDELIQVREAAGLTCHQAAIVLGISETELLSIERGEQLLPPDLVRRMDSVYGLLPARVAPVEEPAHE